VSNDHLDAHFRVIFDRLTASHRAALEELRDGNAALARAAAKGKLKPDGSRMSYLRTRDDDDPEYRTSEEEMAAEITDQARVIADLDEALTKIAEIAGDYGDGAPDDHYLAHTLLQLESIATSALDEARGTHRKALEAMQKRQQP
jgi:hypothetical protein